MERTSLNSLQYFLLQKENRWNLKNNNILIKIEQITLGFVILLFCASHVLKLIKALKLFLECKIR